MIFGIAGKIASGKSTLARALAARIGGERLGFGDYVREVARSKGLDFTDRNVLQELGQQLVTADPAAFVGGILRNANYASGRPIVFDGVRHVVVWNEIADVARLSGDAATLVYLDMPEEIRRARLAARGLSITAASAFDKHVSEQELDGDLQTAATMKLDARQETTALVDAILCEYQR